jgi:hypothetical protein
MESNNRTQSAAQQRPWCFLWDCGNFPQLSEEERAALESIAQKLHDALVVEPEDGLELSLGPTIVEATIVEHVLYKELCQQLGDLANTDMDDFVKLADAFKGFVDFKVDKVARVAKLQVTRGLRQGDPLGSADHGGPTRNSKRPKVTRPPNSPSSKSARPKSPR